MVTSFGISPLLFDIVLGYAFCEALFNREENMTGIDMNFLVITGIAALAALAFSHFWYSPGILGNVWMKLTGVKCGTGEKKECGAKMLVTFIGYFAIAVTLFMVMVWAGVTDAKAGLAVGTWIGLGIAGVPCLINYLWESRPLKLFLITAGNMVFSIVLMASLMGHLMGKFYVAG